MQLNTAGTTTYALCSGHEPRKLALCIALWRPSNEMAAFWRFIFKSLNIHGKNCVLGQALEGADARQYQMIIHNWWPLLIMIRIPQCNLIINPPLPILAGSFQDVREVCFCGWQRILMLGQCEPTYLQQCVWHWNLQQRMVAPWEVTRLSNSTCEYMFSQPSQSHTMV